MNLVPVPVNITRGKGRFSIAAQVALCNLPTEGYTPGAIQHKLKTLGLTRRKNAGLPECTIVIGEMPSEFPEAPEQAEGYALECGPAGIVVRGADAGGLFWGLVTLEQLANGSEFVPSVSILDYPAYPYRLHHDDISRKQISTLEDFKSIIRRLSSYKIKFYSPYMEDVLYLKSFPDIGKGRGRLTAAEVKAMHKEARLHNIILTPTYSLIGHQENLLSLPQYRKYAREVFQEPSAYDVTKKILKPFLRKVIKDVCDLFPDAPYFHAGFDEVIGLTKEEFVGHANWCASEIKKHGKGMMMWTDMFKDHANYDDHYGLPAIHELDDSILPMDWEYDAPEILVKIYPDANVIPYGLGGYNNWQTALPDFSSGKKNIDTWSDVMGAWKGPGYGCSMWGDNGYDNHRDLCWNLFAYYGESVWTGKRVADDFEKRFQSTFYGANLPKLRKLIEQTSSQREVPPARAWRLFRLPLTSFVRLVVSEPAIVDQARVDLKVLKKALSDVSDSKGLTVRNKAHLEHFESALAREVNVLERLLLADRIAKGLKGKVLENAITSAVHDLSAVKRLYKKCWLNHNKEENVEVSLAVYDVVSQSLRAYLKEVPSVASRFECLDLSAQFDQCVPDVGGFSVGLDVVNRVPYQFAGMDKTHLDVKKGKAFVSDFEATPVRDVHLIYGGQQINADASDTSEIMELILRREGKVVYREKLQALRHICDWWAPEGQQMWAGGGLKYIDPERVNKAIQSGEYYGLMHLKGFDCGGVEADQIEIKALKKGPHIALFAATIER